jgi:hypothetical protein
VWCDGLCYDVLGLDLSSSVNVYGCGCVQWSLGAEHAVLGSALTISLPSAGSAFTVRVNYETTPASSAVQ